MVNTKNYKYIIIIHSLLFFSCSSAQYITNTAIAVKSSTVITSITMRQDIPKTDDMRPVLLQP